MKKFSGLLLAILIISAGESAFIRPALAFTPTQQQLASVVQVVSQNLTEGESGYEDIASGSGFFVDQGSLTVMTNAHVVLQEDYTPYDRYVICLTQSTSAAPECTYTASLIIADDDSDLALLKLTGKDINDKNISLPSLSYATLADSSKLNIGEEVNALGYPGIGGNTITLTKGSVSGFINANHNGKDTIIWIKTDTKFNPGNSGGAAFDQNGNIIGMPTQVQVGFDALGYMRPSNYIKEWKQQIGPKIAGKQDPVVIKETPSDIDYPDTEASDGEITLSWAESFASNGIKHYEVVYDTESFDIDHYNGNAEDLPNYFTTTDTSVTIKELDNDTTYYFYVRPVSNSNIPADYWSYEVSATPTKAVEGDTLFQDVNNLTPNYIAINYLKKNNVVSGYFDSTFRPSQLMNRAELTKIVVTGQGINPDPTQYRNCFPDVGQEWFALYVCYAKEKGWISGYPDGNFRPGDMVNKAESLKIILNAYGIPATFAENVSSYSDVTSDKWYFSYVSIAERMQLLEESGIFQAEQFVTRAHASENLYRINLLKDASIPESSPVWSTPDGAPVAISEYFPANTGREWHYENEDNSNTNENVTKITKSCTNPLPCFEFDQGDATNMILIDANRVIGNNIRFTADTGNQVFEYANPETLFSNRNQINYFKLKQGASVKNSDNDSITIYDGVNSQKLVGFETVTTPATASKEALKVHTVDLVHVNGGKALYQNDLSKEGFLKIESDRYYVKDIGQVKAKTSISLIYDAKTYPVSDNTQVLVSYQ